MTWLGDVALSKASVQDLGRVLIGQGQWNRVECRAVPDSQGLASVTNRRLDTTEVAGNT